MGLNIQIRSNKTDKTIHYYAAYISDKIVSKLYVVLSGEDGACIWGFLTVPEYRDKGIGGALLNHVVKKYKPISLFVSDINEKKLLSFYKKHGFFICGNDRYGYKKMIHI